MARSAFDGFHPDALDFLAELAQNNERAWFQPRKAEFERLLLHPMEAFVVALGDRFAARGLPLAADPKRSIFRIYRDTRFSRDKSPYKTSMGARFPVVGADGGAVAIDDGAHTNGAYFHLEPGNVFVGGGMWRASSDRLAAFRRTIVEDPDRVRAAFEDPGFQAAFGRVESHETSKRVPPGWPADHPMADMFRWKDVIFGRRLDDAETASPGLPDIVADDYAAALPVFRFLATLRD